MSKTAIIKSGESYFIKQLSLSKPIQLDQVIFANIPGINGNTNIDLNGKMPSSNQIMHKSPITQAGLLNDRTVVYSIVLDTNVGDFSFNYIGLMNAETNTLCVVMHTDLTRKHKTVGQQQGNTLTESIWLELDNASTSTGITVNAQTWQIDYSSRLAGEDERIRLTNYDLYNRLVIKTGMDITKKAEQLTVNSGLAYVAGLRVNHVTPKTIKVENNQSLYIDCWLAGTTTGEWTTNYNLIAGTNLKDYEKLGYKHYVERIASIDKSGNLKTITPYRFITTLDLATTTETGIVKLNSSINSSSETEAATPLAIKTINDNAVKKSGDTMTGNLTISNSDSSAVSLKNNKNEEWMIRIHLDGSFSIVSKNSNGKWTSRFRNESATNTWRFENTNDVTISGKSALKAGDYGIGSQTGAVVNNFDERLMGGFYQCRSSNFSNLPFTGGDSTATLLAYPSNSPYWKVEQLSVVNGRVPKIYYRVDTKNEGKQAWYEAITTANTKEFAHPFMGDLGTKSLNTLTGNSVGIYFQGRNILATAENSYPIAHAGTLNVMKNGADGDGCCQIYTTYRNARQFIRNYRGTAKTWEPWVEVITTANINQFLPVGVPMPWPTATPPEGWLKCNGWQFDKNKYPRLATAYPSGFLPEMRGEFIRGWDDGRGVDPGRQILSWQPCDIQRHNHTQNIRSCGEQGRGNPWGSGSDDRFENDYTFITGDAGGMETRPRSIAFLYIVKAE